MLAFSNFAPQDGDELTNFPPSFSYDGLSVLVNRSIPSLQADMCRKPWTLPPACKIPGTKSPIWLLKDVLDWIAVHRVQAVEPPAAEPATRRRGRPTKVEQARRAAVAAAESERGAHQAEGGAQ